MEDRGGREKLSASRRVLLSSSQKPSRCNDCPNKIFMRYFSFFVPVFVVVPRLCLHFSHRVLFFLFRWPPSKLGWRARPGV